MYLGPTEMALPALCDLLNSIQSQQDVAIGSHRVGLTDSLLLIVFTSVPPRWCNRCHRDEVCPKLQHIGPTEFFPSVPPRFLMFIFFCTDRCTKFSYQCHWDGSKGVMVGFCVEVIYTPPPLSSHKRETSESAYTSTFIFWERTTYSCVEIKRFHSYHLNLDF